MEIKEFVKEEEIKKIPLPSHHIFEIVELLVPYTMGIHILSEHTFLDLHFCLRRQRGKAIKERIEERKVIKILLNLL